MFEISEENLHLLVGLLSGLQILDILVAITLYYIYKRDHLYLNALLIWCGMFCMFSADTILGPVTTNHPLMSYSFAIITGQNISRLLNKLYNVNKKVCYATRFSMVMFGLAIILRFSSVTNFTLLSLPIGFAIIVPIFCSVFNVIKNIKKGDVAVSNIDYIFIPIAAIWGLHLFDYPFLRPIDNLAFSFFGFLFGLVFTYLLSILIPVVINRRIYLDMNELIASELAIRTKELTKTQAIVYKQEKLATMGTLLAGIAHEIKNPLAIINLSTQFIKKILNSKTYDEVDNAQKIDESIEAIERSVDRANNIIVTMLSHSRGDESKILKLTNMNELISSTIDLVMRSIQDDSISIKFQPNLSIPPINTYVYDLRRVFINIVENAIYAVRSNNLDDKKIVIETIFDDQSKLVIITVEDNGTGINSKDITKIFNPFMTTKPPGQGTGLGLSISESIIEEHDGEINVQSEIGKGTKFIISISTEL